MIEALVYLHLAAAYEEANSDRLVALFWVRKFFDGVNWKKLSSYAFINVVSISLTLVFFSVATHAQVFQRGDSGPSVRSIQQRLQDFGYFEGPITGFYSELTEAGVMRFQQANRLPPNGIVDYQTLAALGRRSTPVQGFGSINSVGSDNQLLSFGSTGLEVVALQQQLQQRGYFYGAPTGYFDSVTREGVIRFQQDNGLTPDGQVGQQTQAVLQQYTTSIPSQSFYASDRGSILKRGDKNANVIVLQERLLVAGTFLSSVDGVYGVETENAVRQFQAGYGLLETGIADEATKEALWKKRYVVVIPQRSEATLSMVRQVFPDAYLAKSRLGSYVHAGAYPFRREIAETRSKILQQRGVDARVVYF